MIIDCHGHYTTTPPQLKAFRDAQLAWLSDRAGPAPELSAITDGEIRRSIEPNQLRLLRERGGDVMLFSPKASGMGHHVPDPGVARVWARESNDLVHRVTELFPEHFAGVAQLPQTPANGFDDSIRELRRCVDELGFVGCNLNPDPSGGFWTGPPLTDRYWYPIYEAMVELDVPAMVHVSSSRNRNFHALGAHYLNADTSVFMQLIEGDLFRDFPTLRLVLPHGGGAVPYHWGRFRGLAERLRRPPLDEHVMGNVFFDTCVYHQAGVDLLTRVVDAGNILFASEMLGAVKGVDPDTGTGWDDTKRYVDAADLSGEQRDAIFTRNALRVYPRLAVRLGLRA
ncbi:amidohydrolase family protein [Phytohabitans sp. ZYX-F-186]|uniref:Amidohydrolase family protein n=1 Tax=Phytohabitans maris TaxID=3071409 RepID=A0ABU0ZKK2_9ACTN|nr:amidohydrolase family protein [Phytohabitans sp. ZYX-F-186]MDQ7907564.1 amidohydrolase family protein [Phytohabitans sp. ZYX-F-186]